MASRNSTTDRPCPLPAAPPFTQADRDRFDEEDRDWLAAHADTVDLLAGADLESDPAEWPAWTDAHTWELNTPTLDDERWWAAQTAEPASGQPDDLWALARRSVAWDLDLTAICEMVAEAIEAHETDALSTSMVMSRHRRALQATRSVPWTDADQLRHHGAV